MGLIVNFHDFMYHIYENETKISCGRQLKVKVKKKKVKLSLN